ncbi:DUF2528 family protein [Oceanobacter kriegii]|uniref:DUF2528 family protein n=1 Tax=Oceanobacter kriegii TaxID=64972 RepID=UPI0003FBB3A1|nr:DUF2528 family protein [Oceanobacter kriegii]
MTNFKRYTVQYDFAAEITVEIDHDVMTDETLHEINDFWMDNDEMLESADGNIIHAVLKRLCIVCLSLDIEYGYNTGGIIELIEKLEGWPAVDGSTGIKLLSVDGLCISADDITVEQGDV